MLPMVIELEEDRITLTSPTGWCPMRLNRSYELAQDICGDDMVGVRNACRSMAEDAGENGFELEDTNGVRILTDRGSPPRLLYWNDLKMLFEHLRASGTHPDALKLFGQRLEEPWDSQVT